MMSPEVWKLLVAVGCEDVYAFLEQERSASLEDLQAAAEAKYKSLHERIEDTNARAGLELAGLCMSDVFRDEETRRAYDDAFLARSGAAGPPGGGVGDDRPAGAIGRPVVVAVLGIAALGLAALAVQIVPSLSSRDGGATESTEQPGLAEGVAPGLSRMGGGGAGSAAPPESTAQAASEAEAGVTAGDRDSRGAAGDAPVRAETARGTPAGDSTARQGGPPPAVPAAASTGATAQEPSFDRSARRRIQRGLRAAGVYSGGIDGLFGPGTRDAIRDWQTVRGAEATGYLDAAQAADLMVRGEPPRAAPPRAAPSRADAAPPRAGAARLVVRAEPGVRIDLDGAPSGTTDGDGMLVLSGIQPGSHVLIARRQGYAPATAVVEVAEGRSEVVELAPTALPATLTVRANVEDATLRIEGGDEHRLPLTRFEVEPGSLRLTASRPGFRSVENLVDLGPGESTTLDVVFEPLPVDELLQAARGRFDAGRYADAAAGARSVIDLRPDAGEAHLLLGRALYEQGRFDESARSLARAITFGQEVTLPAKHRHGGLGLREGFCSGALSFSREGVSFRSATDRDHGFSAAPGGMPNLEPRFSGRAVVRIDARILDNGRERNFDFVHNQTVRATDRNSDLLTDLSCRGCDASMNVQLALMQHLNQP